MEAKLTKKSMIWLLVTILAEISKMFEKWREGGSEYEHLRESHPKYEKKTCGASPLAPNEVRRDKKKIKRSPTITLGGVLGDPWKMT